MIIDCYTLVLFVTCSLLDSVLSEELDKEEGIKNLEAEKSKLRVEIEAAIEDGLRALHKEDGDGGGGEAERYLTALKQHVQEEIKQPTSSQQTVGQQEAGQQASNGTAKWTQLSQLPAPGVTSAVSNNTNATSLRRFHLKKKKKRGPNDLDEIFIYKEIFEKKDIPPEQGKLMLDNRHRLEKKLFEWMMKRQEEKKRLKEYLEKKRAHLLEVVTEKCPRFGYGKKTTKKKSRRSESGDAVDELRKANKHRPKYPCCRKCCKKSYLGCL